MIRSRGGVTGAEGFGARGALLALCLALFCVSPVRQALDYYMQYQAVFIAHPDNGGHSSMMVKEKAIRPALPGPDVKVAGYYSDRYEEGYAKWGNFFRSRYVALPLILTRFHPSQSHVLVDMSTADGVESFCREWGYEVTMEGAPGIAFLEKAP